MDETQENQAPFIFSPEGAIVLFVAIVLDVLGLILLVLPGSGWVTTVLGISTIGVWTWFRTGKKSATKKAMRFLRRAGLNTLGEFLTVGVYPGWTILVVMTLRKS